MLCSIIIPVFNRASLLPETLESIIGQSYANWECILIDDASTDNSFEVAKNFSLRDSRINVFKRPFYLKKGANTCRNYGFKISTGDLVQWFDSDDLMSSDFIEKKVNSFVLNNVDMVVCNATLFSPNIENITHKIKKSIFPLTGNPAFEFFAGNFYFQTSQAMFRKSVIASLPYIFNSKLKRNQETELFVRILLSDLPAFYINESLLRIRVHNDSITGNYAKLSYENKLALDFDAYISIFLAFKKIGRLTEEVLIFFSDYFFRCLKKMNYKSINYLYLFLFGNINSLFPSFIISSRIFIYRFRKNV
jgi:glycosyltransferase involved in cell wall biosynthesis